MAYSFLAFILVLVSMPAAIRLAHRFHWFDIPDTARKTHVKKVPFTGGFSIFFAFSVSVTVMWLMDGWSAHPRQPFSFVPMYLYIIEASVITFVLGIIDDFRELSFTKKFLFQFFAALFIILGAIKSNFYPRVFNAAESSVLLNSAGALLTIVWVVGTTNAINMIDGMDGLAGGTSLVSSVAMGFLAMMWGNTLLALVLFILAGTLAGFLVFNRHPARVFMGDTGSMFLGFMLGISGWMLVDSGPSRITTPAIAVLLLGLPVLDTLLAFFRRLVKRKNPFSADTFHVHHMLKLRFRLSDTATVLILCVVSAVFAGAAIALAFVPEEVGVVIIFLLGIGVAWGLYLLGYANLLSPGGYVVEGVPEAAVKKNGVHHGRVNGDGKHIPKNPAGKLQS